MKTPAIPMTVQAGVAWLAVLIVLLIPPAFKHKALMLLDVAVAHCRQPQCVLRPPADEAGRAWRPWMTQRYKAAALAAFFVPWHAYSYGGPGGETERSAGLQPPLRRRSANPASGCHPLLAGSVAAVEPTDALEASMAQRSPSLYAGSPRTPAHPLPIDLIGVEDVIHAGLRLLRNAPSHDLPEPAASWLRGVWIGSVQDVAHDPLIQQALELLRSLYQDGLDSKAFLLGITAPAIVALATDRVQCRAAECLAALDAHRAITRARGSKELGRD